MSFDLYFCTRDGIEVTKEDILSYLSSLPHIQQDCVYQNNETGVYFVFEFVSPSSNAVDSLVPSGFKDAGLTLSINYNRPRLFADEAMPIVENLCKDLDLLVIDPQDHEIGGDSYPKTAKSTELIESWLKSNKRVDVIFEQYGIISEDKKAWWEWEHFPKLIRDLITALLFLVLLYLLSRLT